MSSPPSSSRPRCWARSPWTTSTIKEIIRTASTTPSRRAASGPRTGRTARAGTRTRSLRPRPPTQPFNPPPTRAAMVPRSIPLVIGGPSLGAPPQLSTFIPDAVAATREAAPSSTFPRRRRRARRAGDLVAREAHVVDKPLRGGGVKTPSAARSTASAWAAARGCATGGRARSTGRSCRRRR